MLQLCFFIYDRNVEAFVEKNMFRVVLKEFGIYLSIMYDIRVCWKCISRSFLDSKPETE